MFAGVFAVSLGQSASHTHANAASIKSSANFQPRRWADGQQKYPRRDPSAFWEAALEANLHLTPCKTSKQHPELEINGTRCDLKCRILGGFNFPLTGKKIFTRQI